MEEMTHKHWKVLLGVSLVWLSVVAGIMLYDTYLMWFEGARLEILQPNHRLKTVLLTFPMLGVFYYCRMKIKRGVSVSL